jgi:hypothetical protein
MDILIPLGTGSNWQNNELRYCLRSIERYATGYDRIFVVGANPGFLKTTTDYTDNTDNRIPEIPIRSHPCHPWLKFFPVSDIPGNKQAAIAYKILWAFHHTDISDEIAFWNDDYILTEPVDVTRIGFYHRGTLEESAGAYHHTHSYRKCLQLTQRRLDSLKRPALDYDIHVPVRYRRESFCALASLWMESAVSQSGYVVKSMYCNHYSETTDYTDNTDSRKSGIPIRAHPCNPWLNPEFLSDCKIRSRSLGEIETQIAGRWIFSYSDTALYDTGIPIPENTGLKKWLSDRFPNKSTFEL